MHTCPAWDSEPGTRPKPPSKFMHWRTKSTALSTSTASIRPYVCMCVCGRGGGYCEERKRERLLEARHTNSPKVARPQNENLVSTSPVRGQITLHFFLLGHYNQWGNGLMNSPFEWQTEKKKTCDKKSPIMWCNHNNNIILILLIW